MNQLINRIVHQFRLYDTSVSNMNKLIEQYTLEHGVIEQILAETVLSGRLKHTELWTWCTGRYNIHFKLDVNGYLKINIMDLEYYKWLFGEDQYFVPIENLNADAPICNRECIESAIGLLNSTFHIDMASPSAVERVVMWINDTIALHERLDLFIVPVDLEPDER